MKKTKMHRDIIKLKKIEERARKLQFKLDQLDLAFCEIKNDKFIFSNEWQDYCKANNLNIYYSFRDVLC